MIKALVVGLFIGFMIGYSVRIATVQSEVTY